VTLKHYALYGLALAALYLLAKPYAPGAPPNTETLEWERCIASNGHPTRDGWTRNMTGCSWKGVTR
jgi:hypothetical protein